VATVALCVVLPVAARRRPGDWTGRLSRGLAIALLVSFVAYHPVVAIDEGYSLEFDLPLHLTDVVTVVAAIALWRPRPGLAFELTYFWGLTGSLQAVLTPSLGADHAFPSFYFWQYHVTHSGVVLAAIFLAYGLELTPRRGAVLRVFGATVCLAAVAATGNLLTGGNYMFLTRRPSSASLLDYMGPWPWYLLSAAVFALVVFALLDLPFRRRRRSAAAAGAAA
jgi:hypothetical integral membrane protein (TIGR02206 family)